MAKDSSPAQLSVFLTRRWHSHSVVPASLLSCGFQLCCLAQSSAVCYMSLQREHILQAQAMNRGLGASCTHSWSQPCPQPKDPVGLSTWAAFLLYGIASIALTNVQTTEMCSSTQPDLYSSHSPSLPIPQTSPTLLHFSVW